MIDVFIDFTLRAKSIHFEKPQDKAPGIFSPMLLSKPNTLDRVIPNTYQLSFEQFEQRKNCCYRTNHH
jgi:hypothetical protein